MNPQTWKLLRKAWDRREALAAHTNALRRVNGKGDSLPGLVLEGYNRHYAAQVFDPRWLNEREGLMDLAVSRGHAEFFVVKDRTKSSASRPDAFRTEVWIRRKDSQTTVEESGVKFGVDVNDGLNAGLFLDMRANRRKIAGLAKGKKVLNCFAYTCSFGVHCRVAGAGAVVNVDISAKSLARGRANYELNGLTPERNEFIRADAAQYLERALEKANHFDVIILDPPSFARHEGKNFSVKRDLAKLITAAVRVLNPGGLLFAATNFSGLMHEDVEEMATAAERRIKSVERLGQDEDFPASGRMPESSLTAVLFKY